MSPSPPPPSTPPFSAHLSQFRYAPPSLPTTPRHFKFTPPSPPTSPTPSTPPPRTPRHPRAANSPKKTTTPATPDGRSPYFKRSASEVDGEGESKVKVKGEGEGEEDVKPAKKKKKKPARPFADASVYADLDELNDFLGPALDVIMAGINPGALAFPPSCLHPLSTEADQSLAGVSSAKLGQHCASGGATCLHAQPES